MTGQQKSAFEDLETRAKSLAGAELRDRISLRNHIVTVEIGAFQVERDMTQRLSFDVVVEVAPQHAPLGDDVDRILSYDTIAQAIELELASERLNLLETLAERVADRLLTTPQAMRVFVRVQKLDRGPGALGVEIVRDKVLTAPPSDKSVDFDALHPVVLYLSNAALGSPYLRGWLDQLLAMGEKCVICLAPADLDAVPMTDHAKQWRIDLLSMEQNGWRLSVLDPALVVVQSRTELDWALRNANLAIWAPAKIALDALGSPKGSAQELAHWLAGELDAKRMIIIDERAETLAGSCPTNIVSPDKQSLGLKEPPK